MLYKSQGKLTAAEPLYRRALALFEKALGPTHPTVAACLANYAQLLRKLKRRDEAREVEARTDAIAHDHESLGAVGGAVTATLNPQCTSFRLAVRPSPIHRWGVFAAEPIPPRRKVIEYTGERISRRESRRRAFHGCNYLFHLDAHWRLDGAVRGSGAELINHCCNPNLYSCLVRGHLLYFSKRRIEPGEELTVDYRFARDVRG